MVGDQATDRDDPDLRAQVAIAALDPAQDVAAIADRFGLTPQEVEAWRDRLIVRAPELFATRSSVSVTSEIASLRQEIRLLQRSEQRRFHEIAALTRIAEGKGWLKSLRAAPGGLVDILPRRPQLRAAILARMSPETKRRIKRLLGRST